MNKSIKCMGCGTKVEDSFHWKCEGCRAKDLKKKQCTYHEPATHNYSTTCLRCGVNIVPKEWREQ